MWLAQHLSALGAIESPGSSQAYALFSLGLPAELLGSSQFCHSTLGFLFTLERLVQGPHILGAYVRLVVGPSPSLTCLSRAIPPCSLGRGAAGFHSEVCEVESLPS